MNNINNNGLNELNPYFVGYNMILQAMNNPDIYDGIKKSLNYINTYLNALDIFIYKLDNNGIYKQFINCQKMVSNDNILSLLNNNKIDNENNIVTIPIVLNHSIYKMVIVDSNIKDNVLLINILKNSFTVILEKYEQFDELQKNNYRDGLTGLDNRTSYNETIKLIDSNKDKYIFVLFDLFRLKYINDNYSHAVGDEYIIKAAEILKKYFSKYHYIKDENGNIRKIISGSCIYRIGGDEFVLITKSDDIKTVEEKLELIKEEVSLINLDVSEPLTLGINYGISSRLFNETARDLYLCADEELSSDKREMYRVLKIDRRM